MRKGEGLAVALDAQKRGDRLARHQRTAGVHAQPYASVGAKQRADVALRGEREVAVAARKARGQRPVFALKFVADVVGETLDEAGCGAVENHRFARGRGEQPLGRPVDVGAYRHREHDDLRAPRKVAADVRAARRKARVDEAVAVIVKERRGVHGTRGGEAQVARLVDRFLRARVDILTSPAEIAKQFAAVDDHLLTPASSEETLSVIALATAALFIT